MSVVIREAELSDVSVIADLIRGLARSRTWRTNVRMTESCSPRTSTARGDEIPDFVEEKARELVRQR